MVLSTMLLLVKTLSFEVLPPPTRIALCIGLLVVQRYAKNSFPGNFARLAATGFLWVAPCPLLLHITCLESFLNVRYRDARQMRWFKPVQFYFFLMSGPATGCCTLVMESLQRPTSRDLRLKCLFRSKIDKTDRYCIHVVTPIHISRLA